MKKIAAVVLFLFVIMDLHGQKLETRTSEMWSHVDSTWENGYRYTYSYNVDGILSKVTKGQFYDSILYNNYQSFYYYNSDGTVNQIIGQRNIKDTLWKNDQREQFTYTPNKKVAKRTIENWNGMNWNYQNLENNTYDTKGNLTHQLLQYYFMGIWYNSSQALFTYNSNGTIALSVLQGWNSVTNAWENSLRSSYSYTQSDKIQTLDVEDWNNSYWVNRTAATYTYDSSNNLSDILTLFWIDSTWKYSNRETYLYNANGTLYRILSESWFGKWENSSQETYTYFLPAGVNDYLRIKGIVVYPNPSNGEITIQVEKSEQALDVILTDLKGSIISAWKNTSKMDIGNLEQGIYLLKVIQGNRVNISKIVKQ